METSRPGTAEPLDSANSEATIDVERTFEENSEQLVIDSAKPSVADVPLALAPSSPKKKKFEAVLLEQLALSQLHGICARFVPAIGIVHGEILDQGLVLIKRISVLQRSIASLCSWAVKTLGKPDVISDAVGVAILESGLTEFTYDMSSLRACLPAGLEAPLVLRSFRFLNSYDQLVLQTRCALYSPDLDAKIRSVPCYRQAGLNSVPAPIDSRIFEGELKEACGLVSKSPLMAAKTRLLKIEGQEHDRLMQELYTRNDEAYLDRVFLELRRNINKRILDLERIWMAKRAKTEPSSEENGKDSLFKFRSHMAQLAAKEFSAANASLSIKPPPLSGPDYLPSIQIKPAGKSTSGSNGAAVKRKSPAPSKPN